MITKEYRLTVAMKAEVHITVNGIGIKIPFANGSFNGGLRSNGYYTTSDPATQDALESNEMYNKMYIISRVKKSVDTPVKVVPKVVIPEPEVEETPKLKPKLFPEVTNGQGAKKILVQELGLTFATAPKDVAGIRKLAKEHNIDFPNWE